MSNPFGSTTGTDERAGRALMEGLMSFDLGAEATALREEEQFTSGDRNSRTLAKDVDFRVLLSVLRPGAELDEQDGDARASIQVLEGRAVLRVQDEQAELKAWQMAVVDAGQPWNLRATSDCTLLLTLAWPTDVDDPIRRRG
jgi:quercetin dioxygenase-like cupin family protein